jgi:cell division protein FtsQ
VKLDNGMSVALGREQSANMLKERVDRLTGIYPQLASRLKDIDTIDMRYPNGLALSAHGLTISDTHPVVAAPKKNLPPIRKLP